MHVMRFLQIKVIIFPQHLYGLVLAVKNEFVLQEIRLMYCALFNFRLQRAILFHNL